MNQSTAKLLMFAFFIVCALYGIRSFGGEVATLHTTDAEGKTYTTPIWVIDHGQQIWIRSLDPTSAWLDRLIKHPEVRLQRGDALTAYRATPFAHRRARINALMTERYGWAEWILAKIEDRDQAVPVYLDPSV